MKVHARVTLTIRDLKTGKVASRRVVASRSYVLAFLDILYGLSSQTTNTIPDTGGTNRSVTVHSQNLAFHGGDDVDTFGIVVGTGATAVAIGDNKLVTKIAHGVGAGALDYQAMQFTPPGTSGSTRRFIATRVFVNSSGASITVNECGIYCLATSTPYYFCIVRDLVSPGVAVGNGQSLTIQYTIGVTA